VYRSLQTNQGSCSFTKLVPTSHNPWHHIPEEDVNSYNYDDLQISYEDQVIYFFADLHSYMTKRNLVGKNLL